MRGKILRMFQKLDVQYKVQLERPDQGLTKGRVKLGKSLRKGSIEQLSPLLEIVDEIALGNCTR